MPERPQPIPTVLPDRIFKLPRLLSGTETAEFFVLLSSDQKNGVFRVHDMKFISGSQKMKVQGQQLKTIDFHISAPSEGRSFLILDPAGVYSLN